MTSACDIVVTGFGGVTAAGLGFDAHLAALASSQGRSGAAAYSLRAFNPAPLLADRRVLKAVTHTDALGLVATEQLRQALGDGVLAYPAARRGLYFGTMAPTPSDNDPYLDAIAAARGEGGRISVRAFGQTSRSARPTTLLAGLANNVLCYAALQFDARGANSNYVSGPISGCLAVLSASRRLRWGKLDAAVAGGYAASTEAVLAAAFASLGQVRAEVAGEDHVIAPYAFRSAGEAGVRSGTILADGATALMLERRAAATARGARIFATLAGGAAGQDGLGPLQVDVEGRSLTATIHEALTDAGVEPEAVGLVWLNAAGIEDLDRGEWAALDRVFPATRERPALAASSRALGNLMEAAGVFETAAVSALYELGEVPLPLQSPEHRREFPVTIASARPYALVLRLGHHGDHSCLVVKREKP